jgi:monothiol glutaredoxin
MNIHNDEVLGRPINTAAGRGRPAEERIQAFVQGSTLMLFVKGTPTQPMCGFSATVMDLFNRMGAPYATFNILEDPEIREGAKAFSKWPTFPQIYVGGEFVGGCDIAVQMYQQGELQEVVKEAIEKQGPGRAHVQDDMQRQAAAAEQMLPVPPGARALGEGAAEVKQIRPRKANLLGLESFVVVDVRNPDELEICKLPSAYLIPLPELGERFAVIPKDANVLMVCRSGGRSQRAGEFLVSQGYRHVWNLDGGVLAWSDEVDPSFKKY